MRNFKGSATARRQWLNEKNRIKRENYGCVSVSAASYARLHTLCEEHCLSIGGFVEDIIEQSLDREVGK